MVFLSPFAKNKYVKSFNKPDLPNGAMYLSKISYLQKKKSFVTNETIGYVMPPNKSIDIDNEIDWKTASLLMRKSNEK